MEEELADRLGVILQRYSAAAIGEIDAREVLREIFETIYRLDITLPARWVMLDKTIATLAGVGARDLPRPQRLRGRPALRRCGWRPSASGPTTSPTGRAPTSSRYAEAFLEYPFQLSELLDEFKDGELEITVRPEGFSEAVDKVQASANRLVLALVASALILGSAVIAVFARSTDFAGLSLIAIPGFLIAFAIVAWLCLGIFRSGRW